MNSIFAYLNYRSYLKDFYEFQKKKSPFFSHRYFLNKAGIKNSGFLKQVMDGKRNLSNNMIFKFLKVLPLKEKEAQYFQSLVHFNQAKSAEEKQEHYKSLRALGNIVKKKIIGEELYDFFEQWYNPVIRELVCEYNFKDDFKKLADTVSPPISKTEARKSVAFLLEKKMIIKKPNGRYMQNDRAMDTGDEIVSFAVRNFNKKMIGLGQQALESIPASGRYIRGLTVGASKECYQLIVQEIKAFNDRVATIVNEDNQSDEVFHIAMQLFPLSSAGKTKGLNR